MKSRVLITGATGFIGSYLKDYILEKECEVICTYRGKKPEFDDGKNVIWIRIGEIDANTKWNYALEKIDYVFHIAGVAHKLGSSERELKSEYERINIAGTMNLVEQVKLSKTIKKFIFISSLSVYGSKINKVISEESKCVPENDYGKSKYTAENIVIDNFKTTNINWCIIRPTLVYGKGNPGNMERLIKLIISGVPLPFMMIRNKRSMLYIGNLVSALYEVMENPYANRKIYVLSDGEELSTKEIVVLIKKNIGRGGLIFPMPVFMLKIIGIFGDYMKKFNLNNIGIDSYSVDKIISSLEVDSSKIRKELTWQPPYTLEEGIKNIFK